MHVIANLKLVIPGRYDVSNYDVQLHIGESRDSGFVLRSPGMTVDVHLRRLSANASLALH
jgi:hypothetical protein